MIADKFARTGSVIITARKRENRVWSHQSSGKVMFSQLSVYLQREGTIPLGPYPPGKLPWDHTPRTITPQDHTPGTPALLTPSGSHHAYCWQAGGTHPAGMHSCYECIRYLFRHSKMGGGIASFWSYHKKYLRDGYEEASYYDCLLHGGDIGDDSDDMGMTTGTTLRTTEMTSWMTHLARFHAKNYRSLFQL